MNIQNVLDRATKMADAPLLNGSGVNGNAHHFAGSAHATSNGHAQAAGEAWTPCLLATYGGRAYLTGQGWLAQGAAQIKDAAAVQRLFAVDLCRSDLDRVLPGGCPALPKHRFAVQPIRPSDYVARWGEPGFAPLAKRFGGARLQNETASTATGGGQNSAVSFTALWLDARRHNKEYGTAVDEAEALGNSGRSDVRKNALRLAHVVTPNGSVSRGLGTHGAYLARRFRGASASTENVLFVLCADEFPSRNPLKAKAQTYTMLAQELPAACRAGGSYEHSDGPKGEQWLPISNPVADHLFVLDLASLGATSEERAHLFAGSLLLALSSPLGERVYTDLRNSVSECAAEGLFYNTAGCREIVFDPQALHDAACCAGMVGFYRALLSNTGSEAGKVGALRSALRGWADLDAGGDLAASVQSASGLTPVETASRQTQAALSTEIPAWGAEGFARRSANRERRSAVEAERAARDLVQEAVARVAVSVDGAMGAGDFSAAHECLGLATEWMSRLQARHQSLADEWSQRAVEADAALAQVLLPAPPADDSDAALDQHQSPLAPPAQPRPGFLARVPGAARQMLRVIYGDVAEPDGAVAGGPGIPPAAQGRQPQARASLRDPQVQSILDPLHERVRAVVLCATHQGLARSLEEAQAQLSLLEERCHGFTSTLRQASLLADTLVASVEVRMAEQERSVNGVFLPADEELVAAVAANFLHAANVQADYRRVFEGLEGTGTPAWKATPAMFHRELERLVRERCAPLRTLNLTQFLQRLQNRGELERLAGLLREVPLAMALDTACFSRPLTRDQRLIAYPSTAAQSLLAGTGILSDEQAALSADPNRITALRCVSGLQYWDFQKAALWKNALGQLPNPREAYLDESFAAIGDGQVTDEDLARLIVQAMAAGVLWRHGRDFRYVPEGLALTVGTDKATIKAAKAQTELVAVGAPKLIQALRRGEGQAQAEAWRSRIQSFETVRGQGGMAAAINDLLKEGALTSKELRQAARSLLE